MATIASSSSSCIKTTIPSADFSRDPPKGTASSISPVGHHMPDRGVIKAAIKGSSTVAFCTGGPHGHGRQLRERADVSVRLSSMVLNHQIALIVLLEQLYSSTALLASKDGDKKGSTASSFGNARSGSGYDLVDRGCGHVLSPLAILKLLSRNIGAVLCLKNLVLYNDRVYGHWCPLILLNI
ncbi:hypothetical protein MRB53_022177 [Persea americana]|uniref:Uncharacterized protein n=1 Tax=Persea americana TaxID=3435 RepID=A0ACC2L5Z0_PERAE|nr:hypothetical protein MRB53_022177 [Persea americana]